MGFKYEEDRIYIVASKCEGFIRAYGTKWGADLEIEANLNPVSCIVRGASMVSSVSITTMSN